MANHLSVVTGANGYLGYALVHALAERGEDVRLAMLFDCTEFDHLGFEKCIGNITDPDYLEKTFAGAETVYHVAGIVDITGERDELVWKVNFEGTKNVVAACKKCGVKNLVYVSSVDCVPVSDDMEKIVEPTSFDPDRIVGAYGKSKAAASQFVMDANDETLKTVVVQPSCCIGPNDIYGTNSVCTMIELYLKGLFPVTLTFGGYNFVDVRDVADGMIAAAEKGRGGECYYLCGERLSVEEFIGTLAKINGKKPPKIGLGKKTMLRLCPAIAVFFKLMKLPPVVTPFSLNKICENCNFSYEKAAADLGYAPMSAYESLRDTVAWIKEKNAKKQ
ncbi:MAG: NAD-dependent epimerase/dehydratase family protein [Clostridia bacterium]|nr:NAD-dependent epimerase/dehydratase family protein [Clostridia bacterium]